MAWSASKVFQAYVADMVTNTAAFTLKSGGDTVRAALYTNSITPDRTVTSANSAYNVGQWATAQEVYQAGQWAQAGVALTSPTTSASAGTITFDAADTGSGSSFTTPSSAYGVLHYDDTLTSPVADQGVCFNYFGGVAVSVTSGVLTLIYSASGIFFATV